MKFKSYSDWVKELADCRSRWMLVGDSSVLPVSGWFRLLAVMFNELIFIKQVGG